MKANLVLFGLAVSTGLVSATHDLGSSNVNARDIWQRPGSHAFEKRAKKPPKTTAKNSGPTTTTTANGNATPDCNPKKRKCGTCDSEPKKCMNSRDKCTSKTCGVDCKKPDVLSQSELADLESDDVVSKRDFLDPRGIDLSEVDDYVNVTHYIRDGDFDDYDNEALDENIKTMLRSLLARDEEDDVDVVELYDDIIKRASKKPDGQYDFCNAKGDNKKFKMTYQTPGYAKGTVFYDNKDWGNCENYEMSKGQSATSGSTYADEHILERQMFARFGGAMLSGKKMKVGDDEVAMCEYMNKFWTQDRSGVKPLELLGNAWPNKESNAKEMVKLESDTNGLKAQLFKGVNIMSGVVEKNLDQKTNAIHGWEKIIKTLKAAILVNLYMNDDDVKKYYKDQIDRVAAALKKGEDAIIKAEKDKYTPMKLDEKWRAFMKKTTDEAGGKLSKYVTDTAKKVKDKVKERLLNNTPDNTENAKLVFLMDSCDKATEAAKKHATISVSI